MATKLTYVVKGKGFSVEVKTLAEAQRLVAEKKGVSYSAKYAPIKIG